MPPALLRTCTNPRSWSSGFSGVTATSSEKGPEPQPPETPKSFLKAANTPSPTAPYPPLPGPCHLGCLCHGSPPRRCYLRSSRLAPPLSNQSKTELPVAPLLTRHNQSPDSISLLAPPSYKGRRRRLLNGRFPKLFAKRLGTGKIARSPRVQLLARRERKSPGRHFS